MSSEDRSLTRREFEAVIHRAAELASSDEPDGDEGRLSEAELYRIAEEVGLRPAHVRRALAELRSPERDRGLVATLLGPETLKAARVVPGTPDELADALDDFFVSTQLLQPVRRSRTLLQYRPAVDWASQVARAASTTSSRYYVASAKRVEVEMEPVDDARTHLRLEVDPGTREDYLVGAVLGGLGAGLGSGFGTTVLLASAPVLVTGAAAVAVGGGLATGVAWFAGRSHRKKLVEVRDEMEGILDRLETGESLEPPPPSWRRWVRRQFHGVARDVFGSGSDGSEDGL